MARANGSTDDGVFHVISANRASHAGRCRGSAPISAGVGNTMPIGWEIDYNGGRQSMTSAQDWASIAATAAVLSRLGKDAGFAGGRRETSTTARCWAVRSCMNWLYKPFQQVFEIGYEPDLDKRWGARDSNPEPTD